MNGPKQEPTITELMNELLMQQDIMEAHNFESEDEYENTNEE
jgi:hypothetical protein